MNLDTYARAQVARFCIEEGVRYGGVNYMLAVGCILRNRLFAGWGSSWLDIVEKAADKRGHELVDVRVDLRNANVRAFLQRFDDLYTNRDEDLSGGALWYVDTTLPVRQWFKDQIMGHPDHPLVGQAPPLLMFG